MNKTLKIAIQKAGRLSEDSLNLLKACGIKLNIGKQKLIANAHNFPIEVLFLRVSDIPQYVTDGIADLGIIGENILIEKGKELTVTKKLGFSKCRLSMAILKEQNYTDISFFEGKSIATSYPVIVKQFFDAKNIKTDIHEISGSVEIAPGIGLAETICDIVSTGSTLMSNGLKEVEIVMKSEAVLVQNNALSEEKQSTLDKLLFRIEAFEQAKQFKYILLNVPNDKIKAVVNILPGMNSPTVVPLVKEGWSSLHSVIRENDFWEVIDELKTAGAEGILVTAIEKMIL